MWQLPERAQILMNGSQEEILMEGSKEESREKDSTDQEDTLKHQMNESQELIGNLIEMNVSRDSNDLWEKSNKGEHGSEKETDVGFSKELHAEVLQERDVDRFMLRCREGRPLHQHPISTSVSGWLNLKLMI